MTTRDIISDVNDQFKKIEFAVKFLEKNMVRIEISELVRLTAMVNIAHKAVMKWVQKTTNTDEFPSIEEIKNMDPRLFKVDYDLTQHTIQTIKKSIYEVEKYSLCLAEDYGKGME